MERDFFAAQRDAKLIIEAAAVFEYPADAAPIDGDAPHAPLAFAVAFVAMSRMHGLDSRDMLSLVTYANAAVPK